MPIHTLLLMKKQSNLQFFSVDKLFASIRGFYGLKGLPIFFPKQMSSFFRTLIDQCFALVYIDDILHLSNSKEDMFKLVEHIHIVSEKHNLKLAPKKSFFSKFLFFTLKVKFLGREIGYNTIKVSIQKLLLFTKFS